MNNDNARQLTLHKVNPANDMLNIRVLDRPGHGGASHHYHITGPLGTVDSTISFQDGPINECGLNGVTHEALLAIIIDRLKAFQDGAYSCRANACALTHLEEGLHWLHSRTLERMKRDVEGTHVV